jgi:hypothetical protein
MIVFDLCCSDEHRFEGWFRSADDISEQLARGQLSCPHCGSLQVRRMPSAVHLATCGEVRQEMAPTPLASLKTLVDRIVANSEDVGNDFAAEARRIHYCAAPERAIRGVATADEYASLREEGVEVIRLPRVKPGNLN